MILAARVFDKDNNRVLFIFDTTNPSTACKLLEDLPENFLFCSIETINPDEFCVDTAKAEEVCERFGLEKKPCTCGEGRSNIIFPTFEHLIKFESLLHLCTTIGYKDGTWITVTYKDLLALLLGVDNNNVVKKEDTKYLGDESFLDSIGIRM